MDPRLVADPVGASESEEERGSASACSLRLSRRERLMNSSSAWAGAAEGKGAGRRTAIEDARVGKVSKKHREAIDKVGRCAVNERRAR